MSSIRETVARALWEIEYGQDKAMGTWDGIPDHWRDEKREYATAAIMAFLEAAAEQGWHMRPDEPTGGMLSAADRVGYHASHYHYMDAIIRAASQAAPELEWDK